MTGPQSQATRRLLPSGFAVGALFFYHLPAAFHSSKRGNCNARHCRRFGDSRHGFIAGVIIHILASPTSEAGKEVMARVKVSRS